MATQIQWRRGNTAQTAAFTGAVAEVTVDTEKKTVVVHDGTTAGGIPLAKESFTQAAFDKANQTAQLAFTTVSANGTNLVADANNDTLTITAAVANGVFVTGVSGTDTLDIGLINSGVTASGYGDSISVPTFVVDAKGRLTSASNTTIRSGTTSQTGVVQLQDSVTSTSTSNASTPSSVKTAYDLASTANTTADAGFAKANSANVLAQAGFDKANTASTTAGLAYDHANGAFNQANTATTTAGLAYNHANGAFNQANTATTTGQAAFAQANTATTTAGLAYTHANGAFDKANSANVLAQSGYNQANTATTTAGLAYNHANGAFDKANTATTTADAAFAKANSANVIAQAAFDNSNTKFSSSGGSISGDVSVTGNLTIIGQTIYANTTTALIADNVLTLNAAINQASAPTVNAGVEVDRGSSANVSLLWNESSDKWTFTNDGTTYYDIADAARLDSSFGHANSAFNQANTATTTAGLAYTHANGAFDKANTATTTAGLAYNHANGAFAQANTATTTGQAAFDKANTVATTAQNAYNLANGTAGVANTDYTTVSVTAGTYGNATIVPVLTVAANGRVSAVTNTTIQSGSTSQSGIVQLNDTYNSTSTTLAATANSTYAAYLTAAADALAFSIALG